MRIIDQGLSKRIGDMYEETNETTPVKDSWDTFYSLFNLLEQKIGKCELFFKLEEAVTNISFVCAESAYKSGLSDGMQLQQEVNSLMGGGKQC